MSSQKTKPSCCLSTDNKKVPEEETNNEQERQDFIDELATYLRGRSRGTPEYVKLFVKVASRNNDFDLFSVLRGDELEEIERCLKK